MLSLIHIYRSLWKALGYTDEELARPLIGVVNAHNEVIPGHDHLNKLAEAVKAGIRMAGGTPVEFPSIGVCDGIVMGHKGMHYSLASRELIADSIESMATAHGFDGLVLIPNCDKIVPGMLMAALRVNLPAVVVSGGPMLAGRVHGKKVSPVSYTHLDVYKRQVNDNLMVEFGTNRSIIIPVRRDQVLSKEEPDLTQKSIEEVEKAPEDAVIGDDLAEDQLDAYDQYMFCLSLIHI